MKKALLKGYFYNFNGKKQKNKMKQQLFCYPTEKVAVLAIISHAK